MFPLLVLHCLDNLKSLVVQSIVMIANLWQSIRDSIRDIICLVFQNIIKSFTNAETKEVDCWNFGITAVLVIWAVWVFIRIIHLSRLRKRNKKGFLEKLEKANERRKRRKKNMFSSVLSFLKYIGRYTVLSFFYLPQIIVDFFFEIKGYIFNSINFDRKILSKDGHPLLRLSLRIAVIIPILILVVTTLLGFVWMIISGRSYSSALGIYDDVGDKTNVLKAILSQYLDPGNLNNSDGVGSIVAFILATAGIVCLSGLFVSSVVNWISQRRERWQKGLITYNNVNAFTDYVVIIGINEQTASIARRALESDDNRYVLIQTRQDVEKVRPELESKIDDNKQDRIVYYAGDRTSYEDIEKLHLEKAIKVYILGESVENTDKKNNDDQLEKEHDAYNISCLEHISKYIKDYREKAKENLEKAKKEGERIKATEKEVTKCEAEVTEAEDTEKKVHDKQRLNVHVQFDYQSTFTAFKATHLYQKLGRDIRFIPFNIHELWAKKVLVDNLAIYPAGNKTELKVQRYYPIDGKEGIGVNNKDKTVHLIVVGMNQMGTALATQAALLCHFPNFARDKSKKTVITFIDDNAIREADYYMGRYSTLFELSEYKLLMPGGGDELFNPDEEQISIHKKDVSKSNKQPLEHLIEKSDNGCLLDVEWEFINGNAASKAVQKHILNIAEDKNKIVTIAICFNDSQQSLAAAMYLPKTVYDHCNQVLVYQRSIFDVANDVARGDSDWHRYQHLFPFGMSEASYTENPFDSHLAALDYYMYENEKRIEQVKNYFDETKEYADEQNKHEFEVSILKSVDDAWENAGIVRKTASIDSVDSIPFKLRSMGIEYCRDLDGIEEIVGEKTKDEDIKNEIVEAEHNRWMMQQLISGFRHLSETEQKKIYDKREEPSKYKRLIEEIKEEERASYCICSFERMRNIAGEMISNDKSVIKMIPILLRGQELLNVLMLTSDDKRYKHSQHKKILEEIFKEKFLWIEGRKEDCNEEDKVYCEHAFRMADTAVSRKQWQDVTGKQLCKNKDENELPVVSVSKKDVEDFLDILRKKSGLYFDIPSIKEWRTAADSGFADNVTKENKENANKWNCKHLSNNKEVKILTVKEGTTKEDTTKEDTTGKLHLHHFFGNVWEWTHKMDEHGKGLYKFVGGSFRFGEKECSPDIDQNNEYWYHSWDADSKSDDLGFRLVWKYDRGALPVDANADAKEEEGKANTQRNEMSGAIEKWFKGKEHKFVKVDSGYFVMGADKDTSDKPDANEGPRHTVRISEPFYICQVPVTQSLWNAVMKEKKPRLNPTTNRIGDEIPQTDVCWSDEKNGDGVKEFMQKLNDSLNSKESSKKIIKSFISEEDAEKLDNGKLEFRLPTEAEWEYAAKGVTDSKVDNAKERKYPIYATREVTDDAEDFAWFDQPSIHEVAQREPNALGLFDMSGNVWEWCYDFYIADMYDACLKGKNKMIQNTFIEEEWHKKGYITDPVALDSAYSAHVFRGGSWRSSKWDCRCTRANYWGENYKANDLGFRLVLGCPIDKLGVKENEINATKTPEQS